MNAPDWSRRALLLALLGLAGCSAIVHPDSGSLGPAPVACTPGDILLNPACPCPGGAGGKQICNQGGSLDPCVCVAGSAGTSGH
jgi:hypothetical protein